MTTEPTGSGTPARSLALLWNTREAPSRGPRRALSQEQIVVAAVALADREGLGALSMRKVAAELGIGTMSLYRYVPGKGELLDLMVDHVNAVGEDLTGHPAADWRSTMERTAAWNWQLYLDHPWLLQVNQARPVLGPNSLAGFDFALGALDGLELTGQEKVALLVSTDNIVLGSARSHILAQQAAQESGVSDQEWWEAQEPFLVQAMETGAYPQLVKLPEDTFAMSSEELMHYGLARLLDGFEALLSARTGGTG